MNFREDKSEPWEAGCCLHRAGSPLLWASRSGDATALLSSTQENLPSPTEVWEEVFLLLFQGILKNCSPALEWGLSVEARRHQILRG